MCVKYVTHMLQYNTIFSPNLYEVASQLDNTSHILQNLLAAVTGIEA